MYLHYFTRIHPLWFQLSLLEPAIRLFQSHSNKVMLVSLATPPHTIPWTRCNHGFSNRFVYSLKSPQIFLVRFNWDWRIITYCVFQMQGMPRQMVANVGAMQQQYQSNAPQHAMGDNLPHLGLILSELGLGSGVWCLYILKERELTKCQSKMWFVALFMSNFYLHISLHLFCCFVHRIYFLDPWYLNPSC